jgi:cellulose synthase/poly-beta-1,6-N-acetylglucosamine synthase-like glycosyltransferase
MSAWSMFIGEALQSLQWLFLLYFLLLNGGYIALNIFSMVVLQRYLERHSMDNLPKGHSGFDPPISILVPAYNEEATIVASVRSMLQLEYPKHEVIVINDGSRDDTLAQLIAEFSLHPFPEAYWRRLPSQEVRSIYLSTRYPNLRVIDKANGGKADALNTGINAARYPLFCGVDADSILQRDSLTRVVQPFLDDRQTIVSGGTVRLANGCKVRNGFIDEIGLPDNLLARFQIVEYLRAFLFGRLGWTPMNAVLIISGAFGLFRKEAVIEVGGYRTDTVGEDMDLILRLHQHYRLQGRPYRICYVPDPICWTEAPESLHVLKNQRMRWQRGLLESLANSRRLLFHPRTGAVGWFSFPFFLIFEAVGPLIEVIGYVFFICGFLLGMVSLDAFQIFLFVAVGLGILLSSMALLLEELSFRLYPRQNQLAKLFVAAIIENFGYRQLNSLWRFIALMRWLTGSRQRWGNMTRSASWQHDKKPT